jgi:uncharacterized protein (DUF1778 family)
LTPAKSRLEVGQQGRLGAALQHLGEKDAAGFEHLAGKVGGGLGRAPAGVGRQPSCPDNVRVLFSAKGAPMKANQARSERVDLRMTPAAKRTLQRAAGVANKTLTEFLLDTGLNAAADTLADRRVFQLDKKQWDAFMAALSAPPKDNARLRKLLARRPAWDR